MYGSGGNIGPDLTGPNRANLDYILREVLYRNEFIQEGYRLNTATLADERAAAADGVRRDRGIGRRGGVVQESGAT